jgi:hypothetical protein
MLKIKKEYKIYKKGKYLKQVSRLVNEIDKIIHSDEIDFFSFDLMLLYYVDETTKLSIKFNVDFTNAELTYFVLNENHLVKIKELIENFNKGE